MLLSLSPLPLFRVLYIKCQNIILVIGEKKLFNISKLAGCFVSLILTVCSVVEKTQYLPGVPGSLPVVHSFFKSLTWETKKAQPGYTQFITSLIVVMFNLVEFIFFAIIIWELFKNQLTLRAVCISSSTNPTIARRRVRKNSITALGHFISWVIEIILLLFVQVIVARQRVDQNSFSLASWTLLMLVPSINYCILPMAQTSTSPELRSHVFSSISCECIVDFCAADVEEGIELGIIYNPTDLPLAQG